MFRKDFELLMLTYGSMVCYSDELWINLLTVFLFQVFGGCQNNRTVPCARNYSVT